MPNFPGIPRTAYLVCPALPAVTEVLARRWLDACDIVFTSPVPINAGDTMHDDRDACWYCTATTHGGKTLSILPVIVDA